jgi:hypothetical protein
MGFIVIKGTYHVSGYRPDGDSLKFKAYNKSLWKKLTTAEKKPAIIKLNNKDMAQLRIEAIDALETHYIAGGMLHQPHDLSFKSRENLLKLAGIKNVVWGPSGSEVVSADDGVEGYILTRYVDNNQYGRPVSFAFAGKTSLKDGDDVYLSPELIKKSLNYKQLLDGMAYPTFYSTFYFNLREAFTNATVKARTAKRGIWKVDKSMGFTYSSIKSITDDNAILPKLFRRLAEHMNKEKGKLSDFRKFLDKKGDRIIILRGGEFIDNTGKKHKVTSDAHMTDAMDVVVEVKGKKVSLLTSPEKILFVPQNK